jgi:hypothetical protein
MDPRTKFRDLINVGDLGTSAATRTATVPPRPPSDPDSNGGGASSETDEYSGPGRWAEGGINLEDDDPHPIRERASAPISDSAASDGSRTVKGDATSGSRDNLQIEGEHAEGLNIGIHDDQTLDAPLGDHGSLHTPVADDAFNPPDTPNSVQQYGGQGVYMVDGGRAPSASLNDNAAIIDSVKTLHVIDVDLALYMPINIDIAVNSSTPQYTASMGGDEPLGGNFTLPLQATNFDALGQHIFNVSDHDSVSSSVANSGGNSLFGGLVAINAGNPAISIALAINDAGISQSNSSAGFGAPNDNIIGAPSAFEPVGASEPMANKSFGSFATGNLNISDHDANSLSLANSGSNSVLGGLLALSVGNPAISQALSIDLASISQENVALDLDSDLGTDFTS